MIVSWILKNDLEKSWQQVNVMYNKYTFTFTLQLLKLNTYIEKRVTAEIFDAGIHNLRTLLLNVKKLILIYCTVVTGPFYINQQNDRLNDYLFNDMDFETGQFHVCTTTLV